ncbi:hypothetical protein B0H14DRAFT_2899182, partial [Mycena olivaceomarginata]
CCFPPASYFQQEVLIFICAVGIMSFVHASDLPPAALRQDHKGAVRYISRSSEERRTRATRCAAATTHPPAEQRAQREI